MNKEGKGIKEIAKYYDGIDGHYDDLYNSTVCLAEDKVVMSLITPHLVMSDSSVLDIGCGTGLVASHIDGSTFKGIDISSTELETAVKKVPGHKHDFMVADMHNIPFGDGVFTTLVSTFGPFSYSPNPEQLRKELFRTLKDDGNFVIMPYTKRTGMSIGLGGSTAAVDGHVFRKYYTQQEVQKIFSSAKDVKVLGINYLANLVMEEIDGSRQKLVVDEEFLMNELKYLINRMGENFDMPEIVDFGNLAFLWQQFGNDRNNIDLMSEILKEEIRVFEGALPAHFARHMVVIGNK